MNYDTKVSNCVHFFEFVSKDLLQGAFRIAPLSQKTARLLKPDRAVYLHSAANVAITFA